MGKYLPKPVDTSKVNLPAEIEELIEKVAENTHEIWAQQRIKDGWTYGERRDDVIKKHPCLVPYEELPESEKVYDRNMAKEALKCILSRGYELRLK